MSKYKIQQREKTIFFIICLICIFQTVQGGCPYPFERCICSSSPPACPCSQLTSTQTINNTNTYYSHLFLMSGYGCRPCPPRCRKCSSSEVCTECIDQFELVSNYCVQCPINCKKCKSGICQSCIDGYYLDFQQKCQKCPLIGTRTCTIDSLLSCLSNYWMDNNGATCVKCDQNCKTCSSITKCQVCMDGYYESNYQCYKCRDDCLACTNSTMCLTCLNNGYYFNSTLNLCSPCPTTNCLTCNNNGTCTLCDAENNFYLDKTTRLCSKYSNSQLSIVNTNCKNFTLTSSVTYSCQNCKEGFYYMTDYNNASSIQCFYGCSITCNKCSGPHYGLCDQCLSDSDFMLWNRHCIAKFNLNQGAAFQLFYTALNNVSFFQAPNLIIPNSCWHEYVKGGSSNFSFRFSKLGVYKVRIKWKIYKYSFIDNSSEGSYTLNINNTLTRLLNLTQNFSFASQVCQNRLGFSTLCNNGSIYQCIDKNFIDFDSMISSGQNIFTFSSSNSLLAISQLLLIGYRCGGVYGQGCIQCTDINTCTKCENPSFYLIGQKCISKCPNTYYTYEQFKKCVEICPSKSYSDDILHQCFSCISPCQTCISASECLTCRQGFFYDQISNKCQIQCPNRYYKDSYRRICEKCSKPCLECIDSLLCVSCRQGFLNVMNQDKTNTSGVTFYGQCVLQCPQMMYTDLLTMKCQQCVSPCRTCTMLSTQCTSCQTNYYLLEFKCLEKCPLGYYGDDTTSQCNRCQSSCKKCLNLTFCSECQVGFYLNTNNLCVTSCSEGYYQQQVLKQCLQCPQNCSACNSFQICTSCIENFNYFEESYSCLEICPQFYYAYRLPSQNNQSISSICYRCQLPCYECSSETKCLSCYDSFLYNNSCVLVCPSEYFANLASLQCLECNKSTCLQCKNSATQCTKCNQGLFLVNGKCLQQCPYGFYFSQYKKQCILCQGLCDSCLNSTYCLSCIEGFSLWKQGQCVDSCQTGYYQSVSLSNGFECIACPLQCEACFYNKTILKVECLLCHSGYVFLNGQCLNQCPLGYYDSLGDCILCVSPCSSCKDQQYCLQCKDGYGSLYEGTCLTICPYGYFSNGKQCKICNSSCLLCIQSSINCIACKESNYMYPYYIDNFTSSLTICSSLCPDGYFQSASNSNYDNICQKCSPNCKSCIGEEENCTSCNQGKILYGIKCVNKCPITTFYDDQLKQCIACGNDCYYCLNSTTCIQCETQYYLQSDNTCTQFCQQAQYPQQGICKPCLYPCKSCIDQNTCLSCVLGIFYNNECLEKCPQGSFYTLQNNTQYCISCKVNCSRCQSLEQCLFCDNGLQLYDGLCMQKCPRGYYGNYGYCVKCDQNCVNCQNSYICIECAVGKFLFNSKCISYCPNGYYPAISNKQTNTPNQKNLISVNYPSICELCDVKCTKCYNSSIQCTQCSKGYYLYINQCLINCPSGSYASSTFNTCEPCFSPCETCSNSYSCETCIYGYLLYRQQSKNQCVQGPSCPNNYYLNTNLKICEFICPQNYYISQTSKTCSLKCPTDLVTFQSNMSCLQYCPQKMWIDQNLYCQSQQSMPSKLPFLSCSSLILRNLLFLSCKISFKLDNLGSLTKQYIEIDQGQVGMIKIKSDSQFYIFVTSIGKILRNQYVTLKLKNPYSLKSSISLSDFSNVKTQNFKDKPSSIQFQSRNLVESSVISYPLQNSKVSILIQQFIPYSINQRQIGLSFYQIAQSISYAGLIIWLFCILKNIKIVSVVLMINMQWLYSVSFLLQKNFLAPNINQFLQGFKYSSLISVIDIWSTENHQESNIWELNNFQKPSHWGINNLYAMQESLITVYIFAGIFLFIYLLSLALSKLLNESFFTNQHDLLLKIGKKSQLINQRFFTNYYYQIMLLIISPISLAINIQLISANIAGIVQSIILFTVYVLFTVLSCYYFFTWKSQNIKKNTLKSILFFYVCLIECILSNIFIVWTTFYLFVGLTVACIIFNIIIWNIIYGQLESRRSTYLQLIQVFKGFVLIVLIIGDIKRQKWSSDEMFYFGFVQIVIVFLYILLSSVFIAQQLFRLEKSSHKKRQKQLEQSLLKNISFKKSNFPHDYQQQKISQLKSFKESQKQNESQQQQEESFFSNKTPLSESEDESSGDIIDFDESEQNSRNQSSNANQKRSPPKNLYKYEKNS